MYFQGEWVHALEHEYYEDYLIRGEDREGEVGPSVSYDWSMVFKATIINQS